MNSGKKHRLSRIFHDRKALILPVDHGMVLGYVKGLESPLTLVEEGVRHGVDAFLAGQFIFEHAVDSLSGRYAPARILTVDSYFGSQKGAHGIFADFATAIRLAVDAVKVIFFWKKEDVHERMGNAERIARVITESSSYDIPVIVEPIVIAEEYSDEAEMKQAMSDAARVSLELGADVLKVAYPGRDLFSQWCVNFPVPIVILGGSADRNPEQLIRMVAEANHCGGAGVAIGRNVWQRPPELMWAIVKAIQGILHEGSDAETGCSLVKNL